MGDEEVEAEGWEGVGWEVNSEMERGLSEDERVKQKHFDGQEILKKLPGHDTAGWKGVSI